MTNYSSNRIFFVLAGMLLAIVGNFAIAGEFRALQGSYALGSKNLVDPAPQEKVDRLILFVEGGAAKETYSAMAVKPVRSACDSNLKVKVAGALACSRDIKLDEYRCVVGVLLKSGNSVRTTVC